MFPLLVDRCLRRYFRDPRENEDMPTVHARTVRRAAEIAGSRSELARRLNASVTAVNSWCTGQSEPPMDAFLLAVDIVVAHDQTLDTSAPKKADIG